MSIVLKQEDAKTKIVYMSERLKRNKMGMTIDNVLEILEKHKLHIPSNVFYELKADIVNFEEPTTKNNLGVDLISRADAIKAMQDKAKKLKNEDTINGLCGAVAILFDMPSVTPQEPKVTPQEPRKGHWNHDRANVRCSNCGRGYKEAIGRTSAITYNFCPNCGSKMNEVEE